MCGGGNSTRASCKLDLGLAYVVKQTRELKSQDMNEGSSSAAHEGEIAWFHAGTDLSRSNALDICAELVGHVTHTEKKLVLDAFQSSHAVPWCISNQYYQAHVHHVYLEEFNQIGGRPAVVLLVRHDMSQDAHQQVLDRLRSEHEVDVALVLGVRMDNETPGGSKEVLSGPDVDELDAMYGSTGWEYMELIPDAPKRISEALMAHSSWPGMQLTEKGTSKGRDENEDEMGEFQTFQDPFLAAVRDAGDNTEDDPLMEMFEQIHTKLDYVKSLPYGPAREREAARVALAFQRSVP